MSEAYIYDHLRTPRGKGRPDGGLHSVSPVDMLAQVLMQLQGPQTASIQAWLKT